MNITLYRKKHNGEIRVVGHLSSEGHKHYYATFVDPDETYEQRQESHKTLYCKNKLGFYVPVVLVKEQLKKDKASIELGKGK